MEGGEKQKRKTSGREEQKVKKEQNPTAIKGRAGWPSAGACREPSPRFSHDPLPYIRPTDGWRGDEVRVREER